MVTTITKKELWDLQAWQEMPTATPPPLTLPRDQFEKAFEIADMTKGVMTIEGLPRTGKTLFATMISWKIKTYFRRPVVMDYHPKKAFGGYHYFDMNFLEEELKKVKKISDNADSSWETTKAELESQFYQAVIDLDEAYKYLDRRRPHDPVGLYLGDIIKQWGHFGCMILLICPDRFELDNRVEKYITHEAKCSWEMYRPGFCDVSVFNRYTGEKKGFHIDATNWYDLFHSWNPIAPRQKSKITV